MQKCILSRLPKPGKIKSLLIRGQIPGSLPENYSFINKANILDTSHPSVGSSYRFFPRFKSPSDDFILHTYPFALLSREPGYPCQDPQQIESWKERVERSVQHLDFNFKKPELLPPRLLQLHYRNAKERLPVSLLVTTVIKRTSKKAVVRNRIRRKIKTALELIAVRGAEVREIDGKEALVMDEEKASKMSSEGFRHGWTYIFYPSLSIFLMPYKKLIPLLEAALFTVNRDIDALERKWAIQALKNTRPMNQTVSTPTSSQVVGIAPMLSQPTTVRAQRPPRREVPDPSQNPVTTISPPPSSPSNMTDAHGSDQPQSPLSSPHQEFFRELIPGLFERRTGQVRLKLTF
ncbi:hypothetical protein L218DRAFT_380745 [Marasmius fiardii PR-910]|nr:hypothetical protein L218DRAFT_380745 [Marasmius fiardii PR-910]